MNTQTNKQDAIHMLHGLALVQLMIIYDSGRASCSSGAAATHAHALGRSPLLKSMLNGSTRADRRVTQILWSWICNGESKARDWQQRGLLRARHGGAGCCCRREARMQKQSRSWHTCRSCRRSGMMRERWLRGARTHDANNHDVSIRHRRWLSSRSSAGAAAGVCCARAR